MTDQAKIGSVVVGGTGMLAQATRWLVDNHPATLVVARRAGRFAVADPRFVPLDADWRTQAFRAGVVAALQDRPPVSRALLWLHEPEPVLAWLAPFLPNERTVLVLGSLDAAPQIPPGAEGMATVRLGAKPTPAGGHRWLTHDEISQAAIAALLDGRSRIVGELRR